MPITLSRAAVDDRKTRVGGGVDLVDDLRQRIVDVDHLHQRARHHDFADAHFRSREGAFDDAQGVGVEQLALVRRMQQLHELFAIFRFAHQERGEALKKPGLCWLATRVRGRWLRPCSMAWSVSPSERQPVARCPTTMDGECRLVIVQKRHGIRQSLSYCQTCQLAERLRTP
jgi:hypothetical protein